MENKDYYKEYNESLDSLKTWLAIFVTIAISIALKIKPISLFFVIVYIWSVIKFYNKQES
jgi:archaellum biogenesis protein FlaJ (TadC family)